MFGKKTLQDLITQLAADENVAQWHEIPERPASFADFPADMHEKIKTGLKHRGIRQIYAHQRSSFDAALKGQSIVTVTPTASGKTYCYNLPVAERFLRNPNARALYIFPTKALAQDQKSELNELVEDIDIQLNSYTYDGDTPANVRQAVRKSGHVVITNPDMLHAAILPHHTKWISLFENLETVVIDELHTYRGVFGSHVANVIRRLKRICAYYGSRPTFVCTSATIANPVELASELTGEDVQLVNNNGAPSGKKHFVMYNPPVVHEQLNIRRSATKVVNQLAADFLKENIQTIVFARSRVRVEVILSHLQELVKDEIDQKRIRGYRGGYLPKQRREIERNLRNAETIGVVSTNALELGVDIGQLQVCVMTGYPGSIASSWQQAGRAGRRQDESVVIMVASSSPVDQYILQHPEYFFDHTPETARININNLVILVDHLKCAAYELPFKQGETFGTEDVSEILEYLTEERVLHQYRGQWHWMNDAFPAHNISLRSAAQENVVIIDQTVTEHHRVIGEMDTFSALTLLHDEAIYLHEGTQHQVEHLDWDEKKAYVREVDVDYYTDANLAVELKVLEIDEEKAAGRHAASYGDVMVTAMATIFKKIKLDSFENIGSGPIHLPEQELHSNGIALTFVPDFFSGLSEEAQEHILSGVAHVWQHVACVHVMCDKNDLHAVAQVKATHSEKPTVFLYDRYPGGIGLSERIFHQLNDILHECLNFVWSCPCEGGCPSCSGTDALVHDETEVKTWILKAYSTLVSYDHAAD
ncbi:DEAD/DEAH box helicase [Salisediminibacterium halotolerans]|uniref:DEAD/DEAH box helicase domain-containing protein n=1 Tax=Salisediminibacterium halotolerans TaxID=517425 RepID=A0A1H9RTB0_9BACI|nr:DEAD/DEAH box helicase [Salisediminibacterium haloalkalitolerans]SER76181.1 DEAD/DEAH box helicase domain-containing protein [Salisediminibacterium haloalkalitolerans]